MTTLNWTLWIPRAAVPTLLAIGIPFSALPSSAQLTPIADPHTTDPHTTVANGDLVPLQSASHQVNFTFTNVLEYSDCLSAILDLYQGNLPSSLPTRQNACAATVQQAAGNDQLSESEARELLSAADFYSTHMLSRGLYPPKGLRLRIAEMLGFVYEIDQHDPEVLNRAAR